MKSFSKMLGLTTVAVLGASTAAQAELLSQIDFSGGTIGQTLSDTTTINGVGMNANFDGLTNAGNIEYVAGLSGSLGSSGNAIALNNASARFRMIIDRTTTAWTSSGLLENNADPNTLIGGPNVTGSLYGSVLIKNGSLPSGFTGLEFAAGDPNSNRVITLGEAISNTAGDPNDYVVLGSGGATSSPPDLSLPDIVIDGTREIVFRIDYVSGGNDTFTLINSDGTDGASGTGSFQFSTLHLASFGGSPTVVYDEIRLGTTLGDVVPEPGSLALLGLGGLLIARRRRG